MSKWPQPGNDIKTDGRKFKVLELSVTENENKCAILQLINEEEKPEDESDMYRMIRNNNHAIIQYNKPKPEPNIPCNAWRMSTYIYNYFE
jgi:hypothetical protein